MIRAGVLGASWTLALVGCSGSVFDVSGRPWKPDAGCYGPTEVLGEVPAPGGFVPEPGCAARPADGVVFGFASRTFIALLGWDEGDCPGPIDDVCD